MVGAAPPTRLCCRHPPTNQDPGHGLVGLVGCLQPGGLDRYGLALTGQGLGIPTTNQGLWAGLAWHPPTGLMGWLGLIRWCGLGIDGIAWGMGGVAFAGHLLIGHSMEWYFLHLLERA